jgi:predicted DNA-binding WGR domain protein
MSLRPTLFGEWALLREWGRIGSAGRLVSGRFASEQQAALALAEHLKAKLSKGYEAV